MYHNQPIGFLDSGVGGLTVVKHCLEVLPNEAVCYIGDAKRCPYGSRSVDEIRAFTWEMVHFLLDQGVKMIVIACNTATAIVLEEIKAQVDVPVIGVINPGARAALMQTQNQSIGVIATQGTTLSQAYPEAIRSKSPLTDVIGIACPTFVPLVEAKEYHTNRAKKMVEEALTPLANTSIDTLVLGCTHYPLLRPFIHEIMGESVQLVDPGAETIQEVKILLDYFNLNAHPEGNARTHQLFTTGELKAFSDIATDWLSSDAIQVFQTSI